MKNKKETFAALQVLKQGRAEMMQDFLNHKPAIYTPSYKHENSPALLKLAREKYFMTWLSSHWQLFSHKVTFFKNNQKEIESFFAIIFLKLLEKWSLLDTNHSGQLNLGLQLIQDMQNTLSQFIKAGENADSLRNKLEIEIERSQALFDREMKKQH
ncbi:MAG: hypothetical protein WBI40_06195 [Methylococcaceae bacterium]